MTFNWGHKITLAFSAFVVFIFVMVYKAVKTDFQLVTKEYYKEELAYQEVIDGTNKANQLSTAVRIQQADDQLIIQLPEEMKQQTVTGSIWLYCPSEDKNDRKLVLAVDEEGRQSISTKSIAAAGYLAKIRWQANGQTYYTEQRIIIK
jgi:hypothetical protein